MKLHCDGWILLTVITSFFLLQLMKSIIKMQTKDSSGTEWTDEKHRSYLNSMEASFVRQLYDQDCFSEQLLNWLPKKTKVLNQRTTHLTTGSLSFSQVEKSNFLLIAGAFVFTGY